MGDSDKDSPMNGKKGNAFIGSLLSEQLDPSVGRSEAEKILKEYLTTTCDSNAPVEQNLSYLIEIINDWKPRKDILGLYIRWSKQPGKNFNTDSITTLLCLSNQCKVAPQKFLKETKTLTVSKSKTLYGLLFQFHSRGNKDVSLEVLEKKSIGLTLTLDLLLNDHAISGQQRTALTGLSIGQKMATNIQHRWLAIQVVDFLFSSQLPYATSERAAVTFSFKMYESVGPSRFEFLEPLVGVCLRYRDTQSIENNIESLSHVWERPESFVTYGNNLLQLTSTDDQIKFMSNCFLDVKASIDHLPFRSSITVTKKTSNEIQWQIVRAFCFQFWLERQCNIKLKKEVDGICRTDPKRKTIDKKGSVPTRKQKRWKPDEAWLESMAANSGRRLSSANGLKEILRSRKRRFEKISMESKKTPVAKPANPEKDFKPNDVYNWELLEWNSVSLCSKTELSSTASSYLIIHRDDGIDIVSKLSPLEVYMADELYHLDHYRRTGGPTYYPKECVGEVHLNIGYNIDKFVNPSTKSFHVCREESSYFQENGHLLPSITQCSRLCQAVVKHGKVDSGRCKTQYRINIGNGGQDRPNGVPKSLIGLGFYESLKVDVNFDETEVIHTIGLLVELVWVILKQMEKDTNSVAMAPDKRRHQMYAMQLAKFLGMNVEVGFEDVTVSVGILDGNGPNLKRHSDYMNDSLAGYTRTGAYQMVLSLSDGTLLLLQVICNFRKVIREYISSLYFPLTAVLKNCKEYISKWQQNISEVFKESSNKIPTPFDRHAFFLDDSLTFQRIQIYEGNNSTGAITGEYLLTMTNPSRVLSFSMFIDPIAHLNMVLAYDQIVELCFIASLHSNPFWFEYIISELTSKHRDESDGFTFGKHVFYDWVEHTLSTFGGGWQGGPYNRWSPCGGSVSVLDIFDGKQKGIVQNNANGVRRLELVIQELYHYLQWVNSLPLKYSQESKRPPVEVISSRCQCTVGNIFKIVPCQFSTFRLSVFTTIAIGCGLLVPGPHLKALSVPAKKTGSYRHLQHFYGHSTNNTSENGNLDVSQLDEMMNQLSQGLSLTTFARDEMECLLCESLPSRRKDCRDWFKKGGRLYDCSENGDILVREYGKNSQWLPITIVTKRRKMAFIQETPLFFQFDARLEQLAKHFGDRLRQYNTHLKYAGRNSKNSGNVQHYQNEYSKGLPKQFQYLQHRVAYFHHDIFTANMEINRSQVLGNGESSIRLETSSNRISDVMEGVRLWEYSLSLVFGVAQNRELFNAEYLQHEPGRHGCLGEVFHGHLDKAFATTVVFLPLTSKAFYALIAFPVWWNVQKDRNSSYTFQRWVLSLEGEDQQAVQKIQDQFVADAAKVMKTEVDLCIYECSAGSLLSFPASTCYHMTITPQDYVANSYQVTPRDLFVIYPTTSGD